MLAPEVRREEAVVGSLATGTFVWPFTALALANFLLESPSASSNLSAHASFGFRICFRLGRLDAMLFCLREIYRDGLVV